MDYPPAHYLVGTLVRFISGKTEVQGRVWSVTRDDQEANDKPPGVVELESFGRGNKRINIIPVDKILCTVSYMLNHAEVVFCPRGHSLRTPSRKRLRCS